MNFLPVNLLNQIALNRPNNSPNNGVFGADPKITPRAPITRPAGSQLFQKLTGVYNGNNFARIGQPGAGNPASNSINQSLVKSFNSVNDTELDTEVGKRALNFLCELLGHSPTFFWVCLFFHYHSILPTKNIANNNYDFWGATEFQYNIY